MDFPRTDIRGFRLKQIGFTIGSVVIAHYEYGLIKLLLMTLNNVKIFNCNCSRRLGGDSPSRLIFRFNSASLAGRGGYFHSTFSGIPGVNEVTARNRDFLKN
ncbi:MAG: hypothetical protein K6U80_19910 [Firmicutes bacterium]|nr:hypothetical protein [Bacillota bacterium]